MKEVLCLFLLLITGGKAIAQTDVEIGDNFSLSGKSITFFKTEDISGAKPSDKIWHLVGLKNDSISVVRFWLEDPETEETTDSAEWGNGAHVTMRISEKGSKIYFVQDVDSIYLRIINLQGDVAGIQMYSIPIKGITKASSLNKSGWTITKNEADELKGNKAYTSYVYNDPGMGSFVFWGFEEYQFRIVSDNGVFNYESGYNQFSGSYSGEIVIIGLYDGNDKLIEKFNMWLDRDKSKGGTFLNTRNAGGMSNPVGQKGKVKKIFKHLQGDNGYVRIVAARYNHSDFDIKLPPVKQ